MNLVVGHGSNHDLDSNTPWTLTCTDISFFILSIALNKVFIINQTFVFLSLNRIIGIIILSNFFFLSLDRIIGIIINQTFVFFH